MVGCVSRYCQEPGVVFEMIETYGQLLGVVVFGGYQKKMNVLLGCMLYFLMRLVGLIPMVLIILVVLSAGKSLPDFLFVSE